MDPSLGWEEPEVRGKRSEEQKCHNASSELDSESYPSFFVSCSFSGLTKNEEQILALERSTGFSLG